MGKERLLAKKFTVRVSGIALEKISAIPAGSINQYIKEAIIEKAQREIMPQTNYSNNDFAVQITRIATAIENLNISMQNMAIIHDNVLTPTASIVQATVPAVNKNVAQEQIDADEQARLADAEFARAFDEALMKSALDIVDYGWCGKGNG